MGGDAIGNAVICLCVFFFFFFFKQENTMFIFQIPPSPSGLRLPAPRILAQCIDCALEPALALVRAEISL